MNHKLQASENLHSILLSIDKCTMVRGSRSNPICPQLFLDQAQDQSRWPSNGRRPLASGPQLTMIFRRAPSGRDGEFSSCELLCVLTGMMLTYAYVAHMVHLHQEMRRRPLQRFLPGFRRRHSEHSYALCIFWACSYTWDLHSPAAVQCFARRSVW